MPRTETTESLIARLCDDPFSLPNASRMQIFAAMREQQQRWLGTITRLVEPPVPDSTFPAFLLAMPQHARLAQELEGVSCRGQAGVGALDELQRFVDLYRGWLEGEPSLEGEKGGGWDYSRSA
jgi:hypothetical protein